MRSSRTTRALALSCWIENFAEAGALGQRLIYPKRRDVYLTIRREGVEVAKRGGRQRVTTSWDAARYLVGAMAFDEMVERREYRAPAGKRQELITWIEADRFLAPCSCRPIVRLAVESIGISGEDDCALHGFGQLYIWKMEEGGVHGCTIAGDKKPALLLSHSRLRKGWFAYLSEDYAEVKNRLLRFPEEMSWQGARQACEKTLSEVLEKRRIKESRRAAPDPNNSYRAIREEIKKARSGLKARATSFA